MAMKECDTTKTDCNGKLGCGCLIPVTLKQCPACGYIFRTQEYEYELYLEKVEQDHEAESIESFCAAKRKEGWKMSRIMVAICLRNAGNERKAFIRAYLTLNPGKTHDDAAKYYFVWKKNVWDKIKTKKLDNSKQSSIFDK